jgi:hypothetical protein
MNMKINALFYIAAMLGVSNGWSELSQIFWKTKDILNPRQ